MPSGIFFRNLDFDDPGEERNGEKEFRDLYSLDINADKILEYNKLLLGNRPEAFLDTPKLNKKLYNVNHEHHDLFWPTDEIFPQLDSILEKSSSSEDVVDIACKEFNCGLMLDRYSDWSLKLILSKEEDGERYIGAELSLNGVLWENNILLESTTAEIYCSLQLRDDKRPSFLKSERSDKLIFGKGEDHVQAYVWPTFISLKDFLKYRPVEGKRPIRFQLIMDIYARAPKAIEVKNNGDRTFPSKKTLEDWTREYGEMLRSKPPDVQIEAGGKTFFTNHTLLEGRSPVLADQLDKIRKETPKYASKLLILKLDDVDASTMKLALEYMYTDKINVNVGVDKLKELYRMAVDYRICNFKQHIWETLPRILTVDNVLDVLEFAEKYDVPSEISVEIIKFCEQHSDEIMTRGKAA